MEGGVRFGSRGGREVADEKVRPEKDRVEGVVDVGIVVISHFENPAKDAALEFLSDVLKWRRKCLIPTSASAYDALTRTLRTRSPAFYEDISVETALDSLTNALGYNVESWDGYIVALAKKFRGAIYTVDLELARKVRDVPVVNPILEEIFEEYNRWLRERLKK